MKVRLNKKTKEELSTIPVLGTLQTKQKQVNEDITTYIDEPFLKPENIRHGITMAGVDGKYADVKYVNIYDLEGNHLRTLASTEPNPVIKSGNGTIVLTNKPFEDQVAAVGNATYVRKYTKNGFITRPYEVEEQLNGVLNETQADIVSGSWTIPNNYNAEGISTYIKSNQIGIGSIGVNFDPYLPESDYTYGHGEIAEISDCGNDIFNCYFEGMKLANCKIQYLLTPDFGLYGSTNGSSFNEVAQYGITCKTYGEYYQDSSYPRYKVNITLPEWCDLDDENIIFDISAGVGRYADSTAAYSICKRTAVNGVKEIGSDCYSPTATISTPRKGCDISGNTVSFFLNNKRTDTHASDYNANEFVKPDMIKVTVAKILSVEEAYPEPTIEEIFDKIPTATSTKIPYYVELPTKAYELGFDEDVAIGETSRMLIQRNSNYMEYNHYLMNLESAAPGLHKVSDTFFDTSRVTVYETLSQRIIVQYLSYRYNADDISQVHEELRVIEDSRTGEFNKLAFSNIGYGHIQEYSHMPDDPVTFIMLSDNANSPSSHYATGDTRRWGGTMGFVFKLRDGKFFIIDGGIGGTSPAYTKYDSQAPILAAALKQYAPDPNNIKIAGWLLTHAHQDHVGVFCEFIEKPEYKSIISIDKVIYSLPVESFQCFKDARATQTYKEFDEALNVLRAEGKTEIVKAHMGMKFNLGGLGLTILSAPENVYRSYSPGTEDPISDFDNINDTCIVSQVDYAGKKLIFMADACDVQIGAVIIPLVAEVFNMATALQVPHHGYADTQSYRLYDRIGQSTLENNLEFTIWPLCHEHFTGKQVNGEDYYEGGKKYNSIFAHSNNAALQNIRAIYPQNNWSVVANGTSWDFSYVDFIDPCTHHEWSNSICVNCGTSCTHSSGSGPSECIPNNDGTHTWIYYCAECRTQVLDSYTSRCYYGGGESHCIICGAAAKPSEPCTHSSSNYIYHRDGDNTHSIYCNICERDVDTRVSCDFSEDGYCICGNDGCYICGDWADSGKCIKCGKIICGRSDCSVSNNDGTYTCKNCYDPSSVPSCHICGSGQLYNGGPAFGVVCENCGQGFCDDHWYGNSLSGKTYCSECGPSCDVAP